MAGAFLDVVEAPGYTWLSTELQYSGCDVTGTSSFDTVCNCSSVCCRLKTREQNTQLGEERSLGTKWLTCSAHQLIMEGDRRAFNLSLYPSTFLLEKVILHKCSWSISGCLARSQSTVSCFPPHPSVFTINRSGRHFFTQFNYKIKCLPLTQFVLNQVVVFLWLKLLNSQPYLFLQLLCLNDTFITKLILIYRANKSIKFLLWCQYSHLMLHFLHNL